MNAYRSTACALLLASICCTDTLTNLVSDGFDPDAQQPPDSGAAPESGDGTKQTGVANASDARLSPLADASQPALCKNKPCACDNGEDDDGDGLGDGLDPECTGPFDDDEASFATGISGEIRESCQDCFYDGNSGHGDDGCEYHFECLYGRVPEKISSSGCANCEISAECIDNCRARTPNGCDCFGCCEITKPDKSRVHVLLNPDCSMDTIDDQTACPRCVQSVDCSNPCGTCELCPGKKPGDLPELCTGDPGPGYTCDNGEQVCGDTLPCPPDFYCHLGCCLQAIF